MKQYNVGYPLERVAFDIMGPLPCTNNNKARYLLLVSCYFTKWLDAIPLVTIDAKTTATKLIRGWSGGAMVLGKLPVPGRPTIWISVGQGPTALAVGAGGGCLDIFSLIYPFSFLSPSLWETARYRLKYCLKGPLNPKQPTNQPTNQTYRKVYLSVWSTNIIAQ